MTATRQPPRRDRERSGTGMAAAGIGAALAMIVCCAGPVLAAAGFLGAIGGFLDNPWVIAVAACLLIATVALVVRRRRVGRVDCCQPSAARGDRDRRDQFGSSSTLSRH